MRELRWVFSLLKRDKWKFIAALFIGVVVMALGLISPKVVARIIGNFAEGRGTENLLPMLGLLMAVSLLRTGLHYLKVVTLEYVSTNLFKNLRVKVYNDLQRLDFEFFDRNRTGDLMAKLTSDMDIIRHFVVWVVTVTIEHLFLLVAAIIILCSIDLRMTLILLALTPFIGYFTNKFKDRLKPIHMKMREQYAKLNTVVQENISGNRVVKAFVREDYEISKFDRENDEYRKINVENADIWAKYHPLLEMLTSSLTLFLIIFGGIFTIQGSMSIEQLVAFNGYLWCFNNPMRLLGNILTDTQRFFISADKILELMETMPEVKEPENPVTKEIQGEVEFRNVTFAYKFHEPCLKDISFRAKPGDVVAIMGETGSGKTSLVNLICRFYDADQGEVLIDGINVKEYDKQHLRKSIGIAMQDVFLFSDTIEGNIAYGVPDAPFEKVEEAAKIAQADGFIRKMEDGYDTIVGERGVGLSGGQKQRITLARAVIKDPAILILDDTTSAVDVETEKEIQKALKKIMQGRTTFIIAHRISSVKHADLILFLEDGRIVERGTHEELIKLRGRYLKIYETQFGNFFDEVGEMPKETGVMG